MAENVWKQVFDDTYLRNLLFYSHKCYMGQQVVFSQHMVSPKVPTTLVTQIVTLWATIATHLSAKMAENDWKQVNDNIYFRNFLFYTQICFFGSTSGVQLSHGITQGAYYT